MGKQTKNIIVLTIVLLNLIAISKPAHASYSNFWPTGKSAGNSNLVSSLNFFLGSFNTDETEITPEEPKAEYEVVRASFRQVTAYNVGDVYQNDSTPCTGAYSKVDLCEEVEKGIRVCAANFVPFNTMLRIISDDESFECIVWDRMNSRYPNRVDVAMNYSEKTEARQFGLQNLRVEILKIAVSEENPI